jgi:hypothetical protein
MRRVTSKEPAFCEGPWSSEEFESIFPAIEGTSGHGHEMNR